MSQPFFTRDTVEPPSGKSYPLVLTGPQELPIKAVMGLMMALLGFTILVPLIAPLVLRLGWLMRGQPPYDAYAASALAYELPEGILASHVALGSLTLIACLLVRFVHGRRAVWLVSVQPGFRWRYLLLSLLLALVILNGVLWLSFLVLGVPNFQAAQPGWIWFLVVILIGAPLQAAAEEFFFRGYVMQALGSAFNQAWVGIVGSALLFAFFHGLQNPALFSHRLAFGLLMGWLVWRTGGLEAAIGAHIINNIFAFGYGIVTGGVAATKAVSAIGWDTAAFDILGFALFAAAAWWVGRRMNVATVTP